jgi:hypothetical protein
MVKKKQKPNPNLISLPLSQLIPLPSRLGNPYYPFTQQNLCASNGSVHTSTNGSVSMSGGDGATQKCPKSDFGLPFKLLFFTSFRCTTSGDVGDYVDLLCLTDWDTGLDKGRGKRKDRGKIAALGVWKLVGSQVSNRSSRES